jgi:hypothetical protein
MDRSDKSDERQSQDERTRGHDPAEDVREEYTTYRKVRPGSGQSEEAGATREAELQPGGTEEPPSGDED